MNAEEPDMFPCLPIPLPGARSAGARLWPSRGRAVEVTKFVTLCRICVAARRGLGARAAWTRILAAMYAAVLRFTGVFSRCMPDPRLRTVLAWNGTDVADGVRQQ